MSAFIEQYSIPFKSLRTGIHNFSFELDDRFFKHFDNPDCTGGAFSVELELDRKSHLMSLFFNFSGHVTVVCDRCLDEFDLPLEFSTQLFVKFGEEGNETDADVIYLDPGESKLNLAEYLYESVCLNLPAKRVHSKDEKGNDLCNKKMIEKLEQHRIKKDVDESDPRWDSLRGIKDKLN